MPTNLVPITESDTTTETGGRGLILTEMTQDFDKKSPEFKSDPALKSSDPADIIDMLVEIGDELDKTDSEVIANFTDFLVRKFAILQDPNVEFNNLMIKINNSDISNSAEMIKKLTKIYSDTVLLEFKNQNNINSAKQSALKKILTRADQYLTEEV